MSIRRPDHARKIYYHPEKTSCKKPEIDADALQQIFDKLNQEKPDFLGAIHSAISTLNSETKEEAFYQIAVKLTSVGLSSLGLPFVSEGPFYQTFFLKFLAEEIIKQNLLRQDEVIAIACQLPSPSLQETLDGMSPEEISERVDQIISKN